MKRKLALVGLIICAIGLVACIYWVVNRHTKSELNDSTATVANVNAPQQTHFFNFVAGNDDLVKGPAVKRGQTVTIEATGKVNGTTDPRDDAFRWVGPKGWDSDPVFNQGRLGPLKAGMSYMALCYRIADREPPLTDGGWTYLGDQAQIQVHEDGTLYFTINDKVANFDRVWYPEWKKDNQGGFEVKGTIEDKK